MVTESSRVPGATTDVSRMRRIRRGSKVGIWVVREKEMEFLADILTRQLDRGVGEV